MRRPLSQLYEEKGETRTIRANLRNCYFREEEALGVRLDEMVGATGAHAQSPFTANPATESA